MSRRTGQPWRRPGTCCGSASLPGSSIASSRARTPISTCTCSAPAHRRSTGCCASATGCGPPTPTGTTTSGSSASWLSAHGGMYSTTRTPRPRSSARSWSGRASVDPAVVTLPVRCAQLELLQLAGRRPGQRLPYLDRGRALEVGQPLPAVPDQVLLGGLLAVPQHDQCLDGLAPFRVRHADDGDLGD